MSFFYKGALVYAVKDCEIETVADSGESVEHTYPRGYSIHGTDGIEMSADDVICDDTFNLVMIAKVSGDTPSVFVPEREIEGIDKERMITFRFSSAKKTATLCIYLFLPDF